MDASWIVVDWKVNSSATGTWTRVARVRAEYPNQLDYSGSDESTDQSRYEVIFQSPTLTPQQCGGHKDKTCLLHNSATGTRTQVARVKAEYPNQLDYSGSDEDSKSTDAQGVWWSIG